MTEHIMSLHLEAANPIPPELDTLNPRAALVLMACARLIRAGVQPAPITVKKVLLKKDGTPLYGDPNISTEMLRMGSLLENIPDIPISKLMSPKEPWPIGAPVQTTKDLADAFNYYSNSRAQTTERRFPDQLLNWMEHHGDPNTFPGLDLDKKRRKDITDLELMEDDNVISGHLLRMSPAIGYVHTGKKQTASALQVQEPFRDLSLSQIEARVDNVGYMVPPRYSEALRFQMGELNNGKEDPLKGSVMEKFIKRLNQTKIGESKTLHGVSRENLAHILRRTLPFEEMQRRILASP